MYSALGLEHISLEDTIQRLTGSKAKVPPADPAFNYTQLLSLPLCSHQHHQNLYQAVFTHPRPYCSHC